MTTTSPEIILTIGAALLSVAASPDVHLRTDIDDLITGEATRELNYATYEPDKWLLDGSFHFAPDPAHLGFVSDTISLVDKSFTSDPVLTLTLDAVVDIEQGVTLEFSDVSNDYPTALNIEYQDAATATIDDDDYAPTGYNFFAEAPVLPVADVKFIVITFSETSEAYRHIKMPDVYVDGILFDKNNIREANIVEEIDQISVSSPSNELNFTLYSPDGDFSIVDPQGVYAELERGQIIDAYETVDADRLYMGRFYLQDWRSKSENLAEFESISALGKLDTETSYGRTYAPVTGWWAEAVMDCIMGYTYGSCNANEASQVDYEIDSSLANIPVSGWLPVQTRKEALQQLAFSIGGYLIESRSNKVKIVPIELADNISSWDFILGDSEIGENPGTVLRPFVTGIKIMSHTFEGVAYDGGDKNYFADNVSAGEYLFVPNTDRIYIVSVNNLDSTATVDPGSLEFTSNFTKFTVTGAGYLVLDKTTEYIQNRIEYTLNVPDLPANTPENILVIENATLVNPDNVAEVAMRVLSYYQQRYEMQTKLFASEIAVGDSAKIDTQSSKQFSGIAERIEIDLAKGFVQNVKSGGVILPYNPTWYGAEYLVLGGGGEGGSRRAGGGGAGEIVTGIDGLVIGTTYPVVVGAGGAGAAADATGNDGADSSFNAHTGHGGGGGGKGVASGTADDGNDGGNGGGGGGAASGHVDGSGGTGYKFPGGDGSNGATNYGGGGGGGNSEIGYKGASSLAPNTSDGGDGLSSEITGSDIVYGGGGGGFGDTNTGDGGTGGGGAGNAAGAGVAGTVYLGGGGGASNSANSGGNGGKGVVILRILTSKYSGTTTGSPTVTIDGDYTVLKFTANGGYTA